MSLQQIYNNENILMRAVFAGILNLLNNNIKYEQAWATDDVEEISVPWFYNQSGDERFMQDFYTMYAESCSPKMIDGNFDMVPRGVITYNGSSIDSNRITSRFVQGLYVKNVGGQLQTFRSFLYSLPLIVKLDCELTVDTYVTALKIEQAIREKFYKTTTFYVYYKGMRVGCTVGFQDNGTTTEKLIDYNFSTSPNKITQKFSLEIETYQPVFDPTTEMNNNNTIKGFGYRVYSNGEKDDGIFNIISPASDSMIARNTSVMIEWNTKNEGAYINKVNLFWTLTGDTTRNVIELGVTNQEFYIWNVPSYINDFKEPIILWEETPTVKIHREPIVTIIPDLITKQITSSSFTVIDSGYFICDSENATIDANLEMRDMLNKVKITPEGTLTFNIVNYGLDKINPVTVNDPSLIYPGNMNYKTIDIYVENAVNKDVFAKITNVKLV